MKTQDDSIERFIRLALVAAIIYSSYVLIKPFLGLLAWSFILAIAIYPVFLWLNKRLGNRPMLAASLMTIFNLVVVISVISVMTNSMVTSLIVLVKELNEGTQIIPLPPESVANWPVIGEPISNAWELASTNLAQAIKDYAPYLANAGTYLLTNLANKGLDFVLFIVSVIFSGYLLMRGKEFIKTAMLLIERVAPNRGKDVLSIIYNTIQNISIGVIGIAVLQAFMFGLGLLIARVPGAGLLTFAAFFLSLAQVGLIIILIPVVVWVFFTYATPIAIAYALLISFAGIVDNLVKPFVLSHGLRTPIIVIFLGVLGGLIWHGLLGVFVGPVILAIFYDLFRQWIHAPIIDKDL